MTLATENRPIYRKFQTNPETEATPIFGISCDIGCREYIVCTGMYEYTADWLLKIIQHRPFCSNQE